MPFLTLLKRRPGLTLSAAGLLATFALSACGDNIDPVVAPAGIPQLSAATSATFNGDCTTLSPLLTGLANTTITAATTVAAGSLTVAGQPIQEHCRLVGKMNQRTSPVDGNSYAIGFEIRMPKNWNGRFFYQANGGIDGSIGTAAGGIGGGGALSNGAEQGLRRAELRRRPQRLHALLRS